MKTVKWNDASQSSRPMPPIIDVRAMVRAEVLRRMRHGASAQLDRVVSKVFEQVERELSAMENAL